MTRRMMANMPPAPALQPGENYYGAKMPDLTKNNKCNSYGLVTGTRQF
jgi:hypothetical protein